MDPSPPIPAAQPITFSGVNYRFDPQGALQGGKDGINVTIAPNSLVAVVGPSGSGKTMLCQLILGRIPAEQGSVGYGDLTAAEMSPEQRAARFAYMPQANALLDGSIEENLLFTRADSATGAPGFLVAGGEVLERTGVGASPGIDFGEAGEGWLRFCYAVDDATIEAALDRLAGALG